MNVFGFLGSSGIQRFVKWARGPVVPNDGEPPFPTHRRSRGARFSRSRGARCSRSRGARCSRSRGAPRQVITGKKEHVFGSRGFQRDTSTAVAYFG